MFLEKNIDYIVNSFGIYDYNFEKIRSVYKLTSKEKVFVIKSFNSKEKLFNTKRIITHLKLNNFKDVQDIYYNLDNNFYFELFNKFYVCFSWIEGREVNVKNYKEIGKCVKKIFLFHESIKNVNDPFIILKDSSNWIEMFEEGILNFYYIKQKISEKNNLNAIDNFYLLNSDKIIKKIEGIIKVLIRNNFEMFSKQNKIICHNSLYYQNFIINRGKVYIIDFGGITINSRIYDLARFSRRILYKNKFDLKIVDFTYKTYNKHYKFCEEEKVFFKAFLDFPHKLVKLGNNYYIRNKKMNELSLIKKLDKYSKYELSF